jgi:muconolactone delta-isomerase
MKILAIEQELPGTTAADFRPHLKAEAIRAWELVQTGIFREMYFHAEKHSAVIIMESEDVDAAWAVLNTLPLVKAGLITFEVIPLAPYSGFARLFFEAAPE